VALSAAKIILKIKRDFETNYMTFSSLPLNLKWNCMLLIPR